jgi:hypothetical protein
MDRELALERVLSSGDEWQSWRALRLSGDDVGDPPRIPSQDEVGGFFGPSGKISPGATGEALCHLELMGLRKSAPATIAVDWLADNRTPAQAWLDAPDDVPGELDSPGGARVWATASAACGLLAVGNDPGGRAMDLLRGEANVEGRFTGGAYPTIAAAGAYWLAEGSKTEMAEWALRWVRESGQDWWGPWEWATALTFWSAARIHPDHPSVDAFAESLREDAAPEGWSDLALTLRALEVLESLEVQR